MIKTVAVPVVQKEAEQSENDKAASAIKGNSEAFFDGANSAPTSVLAEGTKHDTGKARFDLISPEWEEELARVMAYGAAKYADRNWEHGILVSRCYAALRRHINAFLKGEDIDPESGLHHLAHANANLMFLWAMPTIHPERDDRTEVQIIPATGQTR